MADSKQREKCLKEVKLLESVDHPHIIKYYDSFIEENELMIAIEWAERGDLKKVIKRAQSEESSIEESRIWDYMYQVASALRHMHERRIMHRDLKPANIFMAADGTLKIGDLGLGRYLSSQTIEAFSRVGTPLYMSPEVLKGNGYDWKSDVWSLGCIVYELACLRSPFRNDDEKMNLYDLFQNINKGEYPPIPDRYSEEIRQIVNSMIQVDPRKRLSVAQVVELCEIHMKTAGTRQRIDPFLVMDDVIEKLHLLDYENKFCKPYRKNPINRVYFLYPDNQASQLSYFYELTYWLMNIGKYDNKKPNGGLIMPIGPLLDFDSIGDANEVAKQILTDVRAFGVKVPPHITPSHLKSGCGEGVCYVINDLLNIELLRQDFTFNTPKIIEGGKLVYGLNEAIDEVYEVLDYELEPDRIMKYDDYKDYQSPSSPDSSNPPVSSASTKASASDSQLGYAQLEENEPAFIEPSVNAEDWMEELERVKEKLVLTQEDVLKVDSDWQSRLIQVLDIFKHLKSITDSIHIDSWARRVHNWGEELDRIRRAEHRLQELCSQDLEELNTILQRKKEIANKLNTLRQQVAHQCTEFDQLKDKELEIIKEIEIKTGKVTDDTPLRNLKSAIRNLKQEVNDMSLSMACAEHLLDNYRLDKL